MIDRVGPELKKRVDVEANNRLDKNIENGKGAQGDSASDGSDASTNKPLNDALEKRVKDLEDQRKKDGTTPQSTLGKFGDWVKDNAVSLLILGGVGAGIGTLIKLIKEHQDKMNGCWLITKGSGHKEKVKLLTCNGKNWKVGDDGTISEWGSEAPNPECSSTQKPPCVNPCDTTKPSSTTNCCVPPGVPCCDQRQGGEMTRICTQYLVDKNNNPIIEPKQTDPSCGTCIGQCKGATCSALCDCSQIANCPKNTYLKCVNVDFWGAAGDFLGDALGVLLGGFFKGLWRVAKWIILAVGIVVLALVAWKVITFIISEMKGKKSAFGWKRRPPRLK